MFVLPVFAGATQESFTLVCEIIVALRRVGGSGKEGVCGGGETGGEDEGGVDVLVGVAEASGEGLLSPPPEYRAVTEKV